jgi:hypothetical protein
MVTETAKSLRHYSAETIIEQRREANRPNGTKVFPAGLGVHCTLMRFFSYSYGGTSGSTQNSVADIILPLPRQLQDSFKINVMGDELGILGDGAAQFANSPEKLNAIAQQAGKATVQAGVDLAKSVESGNYASAFGMGTDTAQFLVRAGLGKIAPDIANGISAGRGTAINPFATLVFKGVDLKSHTLEWLLSPESEEESRTLKDIIRTIQNMVLPKVQSALGVRSDINAIDRGILRYPAMVDVYLQGIDMNYYFKFKTSMISQFSVDYTPNGLAINKGGRPSAMRITMTLQEAYIHTAEDHDTAALSTEAIAEKKNEADVRIDVRVNNLTLFEVSSGDSADKNKTGASGQSATVLGGTVPFEAGPGETLVTTADGQAVAQAASPALLSDEVKLGGVLYTINQLVAQGVDRATILANPSVYVPSSPPQA